MSFSKLVQFLQQTIADAQSDIHHRLVVMYWTIGQGMARNLVDNSQETLASLSRKLSPKIRIHERTLQQCHQFFSVYPELNRDLDIGWSQYRCLLSLPSEKDRRYWEKRILKENLNQKQLLGLLKEMYRQPLLISGPRIAEPVRGLVHHYRLVSVDYLNDGEPSMMIDCGFQNRIVPPETSWKLINKRIVRSEWSDGRYQIKITREKREKIYTFTACVARVVDGDTLLADVDCGFDIWSRQRLRMKGIDAFEIDTVAGQQTKQFVEKELAGLRFIVVRTAKDPEKFGRYLADIFYLRDCDDAARVASEGKYLNQILLDKGLAEVYGQK